jgi:hypothetical protein
LAPKADVDAAPNVDGTDAITPKAGFACPKAVLVVVFPKADGVAPNADGGFEVDEPLDPNENADAGIVPKGDDPKDEVVAGFPKFAVPPNAD